MTLSSVPAAKCRGLPAGRGRVCGFCGSLCRVCMWYPHRKYGTASSAAFRSIPPSAGRENPWYFLCLPVSKSADFSTGTRDAKVVSTSS